MRNENLKLEDLKCWVKRGKGIAKERDEAKRREERDEAMRREL